MEINRGVYAQRYCSRAGHEIILKIMKGDRTFDVAMYSSDKTLLSSQRVKKGTVQKCSSQRL